MSKYHCRRRSQSFGNLAEIYQRSNRRSSDSIQHQQILAELFVNNNDNKSTYDNINNRLSALSLQTDDHIDDIFPSPTDMPLEEVGETDSIVNKMSYGSLADSESFSGQSFINWLVEHVQYAGTRKEGISMAQRLLDCEYLYCIEHNNPGQRFHDSIDYHYKLALTADDHPSSPDFQLADTYLIKTDPFILSNHLMIKGLYSYNRIFAVVSSKDLSLYIFRSFHSIKPARVYLLRSFRPSAGTTASDETPFIRLNFDNVANHNNEEDYGEWRENSILLLCRDWDQTQIWMDCLAKRKRVVTINNNASLRTRRQMLMLQRQQSLNNSIPSVGRARSVIVTPSHSKTILPNSPSLSPNEASDFENDHQEDTTLPLESILSTPQYSYTLGEYMQKQLCDESYRFLCAARAYKRYHNLYVLNDTESKIAMNIEDVKKKIRTMANYIYEEFLSKSAPSMINVGAHIFSSTAQLIKNEEYEKDMFDEAYVCVFELVERDVYRRFTKSNHYKEMLENPPSLSENTIHSKHRRKRSWDLVIFEDDIKELDVLANAFEKESSTVKERLYRFRKYKRCFRGSQFVDWLYHKKHVATRMEGVAVGQRMLDCGIICHVAFEHDFLDLSNLFYTFEINTLVNKEEIKHLWAYESQIIFEGPLLLKGVHYVPIYAVIYNQMLYLFRYKHAEYPISVVSLENSNCSINQHEKIKETSYLELETSRPRKILAFRIENEAIRNIFLQALVSSNVILKQWCIEKETPQRTLSF